MERPELDIGREWKFICGTGGGNPWHQVYAAVKGVGTGECEPGDRLLRPQPPFWLLPNPSPFKFLQQVMRCLQSKIVSK
jgi:hypothetical protein